MRKCLIEEKPSLNELYHHGIKGMRWGIRKDLEKNRSDGGRIKAGTSFGRLSANSNEKQKGGTYVSEKDSDSIVDKEMGENYKEYIRSQYVKGLNDKQKKDLLSKYTRYGEIPLTDYDLTNKVDLILPSMKEKGKIFCDKFLKSDVAKLQIAEGYAVEMVGKNNWKNMDQKSKDNYIKEHKSVLDAAHLIYKNDGFQLDDDGSLTSIDSIKNVTVLNGYKIFTGALNDRKVMSMYQNELKKQGFNAVSDDYDIDDAKARSVEKMLMRREELMNTTGLSSYFTKRGRENLREQTELAKMINPAIKESGRNWQSLANNRTLRKQFTGSGLIIFEREGVLEIRKKNIFQD